MRAAVMAVLLLTAAACTPARQDAVTRDAARATATRVLVRGYPALPVAPALDCIMATASAPQINALATDSVTGPREGSRSIVAVVMAEPRVQACLRAAGASDAAMRRAG